MTDKSITMDDIQAYVDDRLDPHQRRMVEGALAVQPEMARRVATMIAQRDLLHRALSPVMDEPIPARLDIQHIAAKQSRPRRIAFPYPAIAASLALTMVSGTAGWQLRDMTLAPKGGISAIRQEATDSYLVYATDAQRPVEIEDSQKLNRWIGRRLNRSVGAPDLTNAGFELLGGRVVATAHGAAGFYVFENIDGSRLGVLVRPMKIDQTAKMAEYEAGELTGFSWADDGLGYSLVGSAPVSMLSPVANEIRRQSLKGDNFNNNT